MPSIDDKRLDAPATQRNKGAILDVLKGHVAAARPHLLEIASGTGQHVAHFAASWPQSAWWPSDREARHIASIDAWTRHAGVENAASARLIDVTSPQWRSGEPLQDWPSHFEAILTANIVHIAPWSATEGLIEGAARRLTTNGHLFIYGPFKRNGQHTAASNAAFDHGLRTQDPSWGVRDVSDIDGIAGRHGLKLAEIVEMPANNLTLILEPV